MAITKMLIDQALQPVQQGLEAVATNTGVSLVADPLAISAPQPASVDSRIEEAVGAGLSLLSDVPDYLDHAQDRMGMRNNRLFQRLNTIEPTVHPFENQTTLTITHNRGRYLRPVCYDQTGEQIEVAVSQPDLNTVQLFFSQSLSGTVVLS